MNDTLVGRALAAHEEEEAIRREKIAEDQKREREYLRQKLMELFGDLYMVRDGGGRTVVLEDDGGVSLVFRSKSYDLGVRLVGQPHDAPWHTVSTTTAVYALRSLGKFLEKNIALLPPPEPEILVLHYNEDGKASCPTFGCIGRLRCTVEEENYDSPFTINHRGEIEHDTCESAASYVLEIYCSRCGWKIDPNEIEIKWVPARS